MNLNPNFATVPVDFVFEFETASEWTPTCDGLPYKYCHTLHDAWGDRYRLLSYKERPVLLDEFGVKRTLEHGDKVKGVATVSSTLEGSLLTLSFGKCRVYKT